MNHVILAPTVQLALEVTNIVASVEAEYGDTVIEGSVITLAHHTGEWKKCPAPCNNPAARGALKGHDGIILVSHIDLDTVGGIMALIGVQPEDPEFWAGAEFVDLNGPHNVYKLSGRVQSLLRAYWAWSQSRPRVRYTEITDVADVVITHLDFLLMLLDGGAEAEAAIEAGRVWADENQAKTDALCVHETSLARAFITRGVFCNASYYSKKLECAALACVAYDEEKGSVTLSFADVNSLQGMSAKTLVQEVWGPDAGGHDGIAGSPRGVAVTKEEFLLLLRNVEEDLATLR